MAVLGILHWRHATVTSSIGVVEVCCPFDMNLFGNLTYHGMTQEAQEHTNKRLRTALVNKITRMKFPWPDGSKITIEVTQPMDPRNKPCGPLCAILTIQYQVSGTFNIFCVNPIKKWVEERKK